MKKLKNKKIIFIFSALVILLLLVILVQNIEKIQKTIIDNIQKQEETENLQTFSYMVYDNKDINTIRTLITINSDEGIEYAKCPNGQVIQTNNNKKLALDYEIEKDKELKFTVKENNKQEQTYTIYIDNEYLNNTSIDLATLKDELGYKIFEVTNKREDDGYTKTYYKIGTNGTWVEGNGKIPVLDYNIMSDNLSNSDGTVTIYAKITNPTLSHNIIVSQNYNIDTSNENKTYTADSLIKAIEEYNYGSGMATVTVSNQTYNLRVYQFNESKDIEITTQFGKAEDVATASAYAKNMVVVKVNGDLTVEEGATLTSYNTAYGGTKGMMIYCTGTLTNNGEVSMTARGAKAVGENVYLWKNKDGSYEYVPATGGAGGSAVRTEMSGKVGSYGEGKNGNSGTKGIDRKTGGGGSGAAAAFKRGSVRISGSGSAGTSYSGGTGGGAVWTENGINQDSTASSGATNGGKGGTYTYDYYSNGAGGAGNPGGNTIAPNGTGGLLIIYANSIENNNIISSNGRTGQSAYCGGGSSGGGSINIFYNNGYINNGTVQANGGTAVGGTYKGGAGGNGTISIGNISTGTYVSD